MEAKKNIANLAKKIYLSRIATLICFGLLVLGLSGSIHSANTPVILLIPALLPLLIFLPGILNNKPSSLIMLCFVSLLYFCVIVVNVSELDRSAYDVLALIAVVLLFITSMLFSRWQKALLRQQRDQAYAATRGTSSSSPTPSPPVVETD